MAHCLFWQRLQARLWQPGSGSLLGAVYCRQILRQSVPCPVPCAASVEGLQAIRPPGMLFFRSCLHIITCIMIQPPTSTSPMHLKTLLWVSKASYDFSDTATAYSRRGSWERRKVKPEKLHMQEGSWILWKRYWTYILREFVSDTGSFDISPWSPKLR